jgi:RNA methyltransferase, TrmH family
VPDLAVFDGFHAWKHAVRFGAALDGAITDDPVLLEQLVEDLAPDLRSSIASVSVVSAEAANRRAGSVGLRSVHHTRLLAWGSRPTADRTLLTIEARLRKSHIPAVLVDHARHPGNLGAVVRVAAAVGSPAVFAYGGVDPWLPEVIRAAAGLHAAIPVIGLQTIDELDGPLVVLDAAGTSVTDWLAPPGAVLAVGAERSGVSAAVRSRAAATLALPMVAGVSSLNLATSVSAALYVHVSHGTKGN